MRVLKGLPLPEVRGRMTYDFDRLEHGDAIDVNSIASAKELFRRWRKANDRNARLIEDPETEGRLFFIDDDIEDGDV